MRYWAWSFVAAFAWIIPFGLVADYSFFNWQWWAMLTGVNLYHWLMLVAAKDD